MYRNPFSWLCPFLALQLISSWPSCRRSWGRQSWWWRRLFPKPTTVLTGDRTPFTEWHKNLVTKQDTTQYLVENPMLASTGVRCFLFTYWPLGAQKSFCTFSRKTAPKHNISSSMLDSGGSYSAFFFLKPSVSSWCQRARFWPHLTTALSPKPSLKPLDVQW